jgi:hypothetical protein
LKKLNREIGTVISWGFGRDVWQRLNGIFENASFLIFFFFLSNKKTT